MGCVVIIPARLASTRLPNKPLADIAGLPMIVRVAQRAALSRASQIVVATDSPEVATACDAHGVRVVLTDGSRVVFRLSGTGTEGATLRVYLERHEPSPARQDLPAQEALQPLVALAEAVAKVRAFTGMDQPTVMT